MVKLPKLMINKRICQSNNCNKCDRYEYEIPKSCEYAILHYLEDEVILDWRERRSGKTSILIKMANGYASLGKKVLMINRNFSMVRWVAGNHAIDSRIDLVSLSGVRKYLMGRDRSVINVFLDEITPEDYLILEEGLMGCKIVKGFYT